jgi:hypothetical protein
MQRFAEAWARRLAKLPDDGGRRLRTAYLEAFGRAPTPAELQAAKVFFARFFATAGAGDDVTKRAAGAAAVTAFCQALLASVEFRSVE